MVVVVEEEEEKEDYILGRGLTSVSEFRRQGTSLEIKQNITDADTIVHTYIHIISFRRSTNSVVQTVEHETCQKKQYKNTTQNETKQKYRCQYYSLQIHVP
jgi:hypothetical protein